LQNNFTTLYAGITDSVNNFQEFSNFNSNSEYTLINNTESEQIYYGYEINVEDNTSKISRILYDGQKQSEIWEVTTDKQNFSYIAERFNNSENNNIITGSLKFNYSSAENIMAISFNINTDYVAECFYLKIQGETQDNIFLIYNSDFSKEKEFYRIFYEIPLSESYAIYLFALDYCGAKSKSYLYNDKINTDINLPSQTPEDSSDEIINDTPDEEKTEEYDLIFDFYYKHNVNANYDDIIISDCSLTSLKISGEATQNNYPYIILKPEEGFYDITNKILKLDGYFINAKCYLGISFTFEDETTFGSSCCFFDEAGENNYESWLNGSIDLNEYSEYITGNMQKVTEIKLTFCFDSDFININQGYSTVYIDNIILY
jgi:hypothetical protein